MSSENSWENPVYLIFGATGGIGSCLTRRLSSQGARLTLAARDARRLAALSREVAADHHALDATRFDEVSACTRAVAERHGRLDGVVSCVGSILLKASHLTSEAEWLETIGSNLTSAFAIVRAASKVLGPSGGSLVLLSSAAARMGLANHEAIAAAKAGVIGLTLSAAATLAPRGIRVNCVAPGLVRTPMTARLTSSEAFLKASSSMHPLGRIGEPADVAAAIGWLLSAEQSWVTGQVLGVDGGLGSLRSR